MPDKNEINRRKEIAGNLKLQAQQAFEQSLPMSLESFKALFDYLDEQLTDKGCDHSNTLSIAFLQSCGVNNIEEVIDWLAENGGYCDCEVLANVEEKFDDDAIL